jgi:hypothetical protein
MNEPTQCEICGEVAILTYSAYEDRHICEQCNVWADCQPVTLTAWDWWQLFPVDAEYQDLQSTYDDVQGRM